MIKTVYFAHPRISETKGAALLLLKQVQKEFPNWKFINPFDHELTEKWKKEPTEQTADLIVQKDLDLICESDIVFAYLPDMITDECNYSTFGTSMEIFYASFIMNKSVYILTPFWHPWLLAFGTICENTIEKLIEKMRYKECK